MDFKDISYLKNGNELQKKVHELLVEHEIMSHLKAYEPIVVGTIPILINVNHSDVDIVCEVNDFKTFSKIVNRQFSHYPQFKFLFKEASNICVCHFFIEEIEFEIYASQEKSVRSNSYRHMLIEYRILQIANERFRKEVVSLKRSGIKTEPAFAKLLNLEGNPYQALFKFEDYDDDALYEELKDLGFVCV